MTTGHSSDNYAGQAMGISEFRAAYVAAGPLVDELASRWFRHFRKGSFPADLKSAAAKIADSNANFAIIPWEAGFPAEASRAQRDFFSAFAAALGKEGVEALALISAGPYSPEGEWKSPKRGAALPGGKPAWHSMIANQRAACWTDDEWLEWLRAAAKSAMGSGAGGVYFDSPCFGAAPIYINAKFEGPAGCHCKRCQSLFGKHLSGLGMSGAIPASLGAMNVPVAIEYAKWRAGVVSSALESAAGAAREADSSALFVVSAPHLAMLPALPMFGLDPQWALNAPDVCAIEHNRAPAISHRGLWYESPSVRAARAAGGRSLVASLGYIYELSGDALPTPARVSCALASALASGATPALRIGEYRDEKKGATGSGSWMLGEEATARIEAAARLFNWADKNADIFEGAEPVAATGVLFSWNRFAFAPASDIARFYFTIVRTLTEVQVPVAPVILENIAEAPLDNMKSLVIPDPGAVDAEFFRTAQGRAPRLRFIFAGLIPSCAPADRSSVMPLELFKESGSRPIRQPAAFARWMMKRVAGGQASLYCGLPISSRAGMPPPFLSAAPSFACDYQPPASGWEEMRRIAVDALKDSPDDLVVEAPPYVHVYEWRKGADSYFHCVNLLMGFPGADHAILRFGKTVSGRTLDSATGKIVYHSSTREVSLVPKPYAVVHIRNRHKD